MRTTIDLPDDLHALARRIAHETHRSLGAVVADLMRAGLARPSAPPRPGPRGMPVVSIGRVVTDEDVRNLDDEE